MDYTLSVNAIVHVFEDYFASEKCFEKSTSILYPVIEGHNFIKSCISADIVVFSCSKLF